MVSQTELVAELQHRGYHITERQLRDWRTKRLLPPLKHRSQGRGFGVLHYWEDDERILSQTMAVCDLLDRNGRTKWVPLGLWFAGFEVNLVTVRKLWLESLVRTGKEWFGTARSTEDCEDILGDLCHRLGKRFLDQTWVRNADIPCEHIEPLLFEVLNAFLNPYPDVDFAIDNQLADRMRALVHRNRIHLEGSEFVWESELEKWLDFIHRNFSFRAMREIIAVTTDDDLSLAHKRWRSVLGLFRLHSTNAYGGTLSDDLRQIGRQAAFQFGGLCIFGLLILNRNGKGQLIDSRIEEARTTVLV